MLRSNRNSPSSGVPESRNPREAPWLPAAKRLAVYLFVALMCIRIGLALSVYDQSAQEVKVQEKKLADLSAEQRRLEQRLRYLDTAEGRTVEAYKQGWIPAGSRLLVLPPPKSLPNSPSTQWQEPKPNSSFAARIADRANGVYRHCREKLSTWWNHPKREE